LLPQPLLNPRLHQLPHQPRRQRPFRREADRPLAGVVPLKLLRVRRDGVGAGVEGAVVLAGSEGDEHLAVEPDSGDAVADALLEVGDGGVDVPAQDLEGGALVGREGREELVDGLGLRRHGVRSLARKQSGRQGAVLRGKSSGSPAP
jgi:hypothetical protein